MSKMRLRMLEDVPSKRRALKKGHIVTVHYLLGKELLKTQKAVEYVAAPKYVKKEDTT